jgi:L-lactate dehydrogenase complex protein LldG
MSTESGAGPARGARDRILARLRRGARPAPPPAPAPAPTPAPPGPAAPEDSPEELLLRFSRNLAAVRGEVHRVTAESWPERLRELAREAGLANLLYAPDTEAGRQLAAGHQEPPRLWPWPGPVEGWKDELFGRVAGAFTRARGGIAETGSLVLWPDAREPRLMSLVPPVHFVLLASGRIQPTLAQLLAAEDWAAGLPANALLISGPSKSADIEQTLAYGVHGPKRLVVLLVEHVESEFVGSE